jgi:pimeloyl-ACP methyl ester carboxylesterase
MSWLDTLLDSDAFRTRVFFPRRDVSPCPDGALDVFVDVGGDAGDARLALASTFLAAGVALSIADFRGYGASTGTPSVRAMLGDALSIFFATVAAFPTASFLVSGRSLGSMSAVHIAGQTPSAVAGFIIDSGYCDFGGFLRRRMGVAADGIAARMTRGAFDIHDGQLKLARSTAPLLVVHGDRDDVIVPQEAELTFAASASPRKKLVWVQGAGHNDVHLFAQFWTALADFAAGTLPP